MTFCTKTIGFLRKYRKPLIILIIPLIFSILPILSPTKASKCAFTIILMAVFWITNVLPIGLTSLLPVVLFPMFGILSSDKVVRGYFKDIVMLFLGGLIIANAIEMTKLHERAALSVLLKFGSNPKWLMLGFMIITAFISLWITNTAATVMMLPIVDAVVKQLNKADENCLTKRSVSLTFGLARSTETISLEMDKIMDPSKHITNQIAPSDQNIVEQTECQRKKQSEKCRKLSVGFYMATAFSATIGGMGSLVGSTANMLLKGYIDRKNENIKLDFLNYFIFALPISIIMIFFSWFWLVFQWLPKKYSIFRCTSKPDDASQHVSVALKTKYESLGNATWEQRCVGVLFLALVVLWITRDLHIVPGWGMLFEKNFVTDSTPAIFIVFLMFICPKENIFRGKPYNHLIDWDILQKNIPWNIILLIGGGLVIADGFQESGLSNIVVLQLKNLASNDKKIVLLVVMVLSSVATEFTSNMSMASVMLPIVDVLAESLNLNPVYLLLPMILSVSLAFMLPIANPNNAIIFATGQIKITDMITTGFAINLIGLMTIYLASNTWFGLIFDLKNANYTQAYQNPVYFNQTTLS